MRNIWIYEKKIIRAIFYPTCLRHVWEYIPVSHIIPRNGKIIEPQPFFFFFYEGKIFTKKKKMKKLGKLTLKISVDKKLKKLTAERAVGMTIIIVKTDNRG